MHSRQSTSFSHRNLPLDQGIIVRNQCTRCNKVLYHTTTSPQYIYPSLIIIQSSSTHFYFPRIHRNLFLTGIYVVQGLLGLAIIHAGALRTCDPLLLLLLICCISDAIISNLDANSCWLFFPHILYRKSFRATFSDTRCVIGVTGFNNLVLYFSRSVSRKKKGENTNFRHLCQIPDFPLTVHFLFWQWLLVWLLLNFCLGSTSGVCGVCRCFGGWCTVNTRVAYALDSSRCYYGII